MEDLIEIINKLQACSSRYGKEAIHYPEIVVIGSQSSGKSSILERIIDCDILPKDAQSATLCPIIIQLINDTRVNDLEASFSDSRSKIYVGECEIREKLQEITNEIRDKLQGISETPVLIQLKGNNLPTLTLIDLPGIIKNEGELQSGSIAKIQQLVEAFVESPQAIILAISAANVDLANSDSIQIARKYDPQGLRTLNVITKLDLMDQGTDGRDLLRSSFVQNTLGTIFLINRSQKCIQEKASLVSAKEYEKNYLNRYYTEISKQHGIQALINTLIDKLRMEIKNSLPTILKEINKRKEDLTKETNAMMRPDKDTNVTFVILEFIKNFKNHVYGNKIFDPNVLTRGAKISKILYEDYLKELESLVVDNFTRENIVMIIRNVTGNRNMSYSIEKTFILLVKREIEKLQKPSEDSLQDVMILLNQFVSEVIDMTGIKIYPNLSNWIEMEMRTIIETRYNKTKCLIKDLIICEQNDVFCIHPNSECFYHLRKPQNQKQGESFDDAMNKSANVVDILMPPYIKQFLRTAHLCGNMKTLASVQNWKELNFESVLGKSINPEIEARKTDIINFADKNIKFMNAVKYIASQENNNEVIEDWKDREVMILCEMVKDYFDMVQKNTIYNFPKWVQTFLIKELIRKMYKSLVAVDECTKESLLQLDAKLSEKVESNKNELIDLQEIEKSLQSLFRSNK